MGNTTQKTKRSNGLLNSTKEKGKGGDQSPRRKDENVSGGHASKISLAGMLPKETNLSKEILSFEDLKSSKRWGVLMVSPNGEILGVPSQKRLGFFNPELELGTFETAEKTSQGKTGELVRIPPALKKKKYVEGNYSKVVYVPHPNDDIAHIQSLLPDDSDYLYVGQLAPQEHQWKYEQGLHEPQQSLLSVDVAVEAVPTITVDTVDADAVNEPTDTQDGHGQDETKPCTDDTYALNKQMDGQSADKRSVEAQIQYAQESIDRSFAIFPTMEDKSPLYYAWGKNELTAKDDLAAYFVRDVKENGVIETKYAAGHAILTGTRNNIVVYDLDPQKNKNIYQEFRAFADEHGLDLDTFRVSTPSGGEHYYYRCTKPLKINRTLINGLDIQADGAYVVGAGSFAKSKIDGNIKQYRIRKDAPIIALSENVYNFLVNFKPEKQEPPKSESGTPTVKVSTDERIEKLIFDIANSIQGTRNNTLNKNAYEIARLEVESDTTGDHAQQILDAAVRCGLSQAEAERTIESAYDSALTKEKMETKPADVPTASLSYEDELKEWDTHLMSSADMLQRKEEKINYLIEGVHEEYSFAVIGGAPKSTKGWEAKTKGMFACIGGNFCGLQFNRKCRVLYVSAEESANVITARNNMIIKQFTPEEQEIIKENYFAISLFGKGKSFMKNKQPTQAWKAFCEKSKNYDIVFLDTLHKFFGQNGAEASNDDIGYITTEIEKFCYSTKTSLFLTHHTKKLGTNARASDYFSAEALRGAYALVGAARTIFLLHKKDRKGKAVFDTVSFKVTGNYVTPENEIERSYTLKDGIIVPCVKGEAEINDNKIAIAAEALYNALKLKNDTIRAGDFRAEQERFPEEYELLKNDTTHKAAAELLKEQGKIEIIKKRNGYALKLTSQDLKKKLNFNCT